MEMALGLSRVPVSILKENADLYFRVVIQNN